MADSSIGAATPHSKNVIKNLAAAQALSEKEARAAKREGRQQSPKAVLRQRIKHLRTRYDGGSAQLCMKNWHARSVLERLMLIRLQDIFRERMVELGVPAADLPTYKDVLIAAGNVDAAIVADMSDIEVAKWYRPKPA